MHDGRKVRHQESVCLPTTMAPRLLAILFEFKKRGEREANSLILGTRPLPSLAGLTLAAVGTQRRDHKKEEKKALSNRLIVSGWKIRLVFGPYLVPRTRD